MNCGHVCADLIWVGMVAGSSGILLRRLHFIDEDLCKVNIRQIYGLWLVYSLVVSIVFLLHMSNSTGMVQIAYGLLAGYFILCSVMDAVLKLVCDVFHYIGLLGGCLLLVSSRPAADIIMELLLFIGLQWMIFRKMYGAADVAGFMVCAVYLAAEGRSMLGYLMHMAVTFLLLGVIQGVKGNISRKGNLKRPVPLFPYITVGFLVII